MITLEQLKAIMPLARARAVLYLPLLNATMDKYEINTPLRQAAFLAQLAHESGQLFYVEELASGRAYEGRKDLGNFMPGDGVRFKGRGLIQITGRNNYTLLMMALCINCLENPNMISEPEYACDSAGWFWSYHKCNSLADAEDFKGVTKVINGGYNGLAERQAFYNTAKKVLILE
jgi:putative chitinase